MSRQRVDELDVLELGERAAGAMHRESTGHVWHRLATMAGRLYGAERRARERRQQCCKFCGQPLKGQA